MLGTTLLSTLAIHLMTTWNGFINGFEFAKLFLFSGPTKLGCPDDFGTVEIYVLRKIEIQDHSGEPR